MFTYMRPSRLPVKFLKSSILFTLAALPSQTFGDTWIIRADGSGDAPTIQAGIDSSAVGDTVLVMPGRYLENIDFKGKAIVVSGSNAEATIIDGSGQPEACVLFINGEDRSSVLTRFTITGGVGHRFGIGNSRFGGGIYVSNSAPTIKDNIIEDNSANTSVDGTRTGFGGGIYCGSSSFTSPLLEGNTIERNIAGINGGGVAVSGNVAPTIIGCTIKANETVTGDGGGIWVFVTVNGSMVKDNRIEGNTANDHGGGVLVASPTTTPIQVEISGNLIFGNVAIGGQVTSSGGGIWLQDCSALVSNNTIVLNEGRGPDPSWGGGIALSRCEQSTVTRNIIALSVDGGGIRCDGSSAPEIVDNLSWQNTGGEGTGICGEWWKTNGNLVVNPYFCGQEFGDFSLAENSPALLHPAGPLGALSVSGCGPVDVRPITWGQIKEKY